MPISTINNKSIADGTIIATDILDGTISSSKLVASNIAGDRIAANTLANSVFQTGSVENYLNAQSGGALGARNRIINGAMNIDQRSAGASYTPTDGAYGTCDRYLFRVSQSSKLTARQMDSANSSVSNYEASSAPAGFVNSLKITSSSSYSVGASDFFAIEHRIEGYNVADLGFGTSAAKSVTLSFWVKSSLTGTFGGAIANGAFNRNYPFTYTIVSANIWEQKFITIPGDTSGTWYKDNQAGLKVMFGLGVGSTYSSTANSWTATTSWSATGAVSVVGTNAATWYITGVQLEAGSQATPFEYRPYTTELQLCQRYCEAGYTDTVGGYVSAASVSVGSWIPFAVSKRVNTGMSITTSTGAVLSTATGTWTSQASGGSQTSRTVGINSQYNNGWNTLWAGSDPRISGYWWISAEL
jgi:hypothetical protein